jgi:hypothetical protein
MDLSTSVAGVVTGGGPRAAGEPGVDGADTLDFLGNPPVARGPRTETSPTVEMWTPRVPAGPDGPARKRPDPPVVRRLLLFLGIGMVGVVLMFAGLVWDAVVHARDPAAGHAETSVFDLGNPAHQVLLLGGALAVAGLTAATARALSLSASRRLASSKTSAAVVVATVMVAAATGGAVRWVSTAQLPIATGPLAPSAGPDTHGIGIVNSHAPGPCRPTKAEKEGAAKLVTDTEIGTAKYRSIEAALADNHVGPANPTLTEHYANVANTQDGRVLDPNRPEALMYTPTSKGMVLVGVMYMMNVPGEFGPEPGGCLTRWHVHANVCFSAATFAPASQLSEPGDTCPAGEFRYVPPPALHVWFVDVPGGRFAPEVDAQYLAKKLGP